MADVLDGNPRFSVNLLLEIKNAQHLVDSCPELPESPTLPGPDLRTNEIDDHDPTLLEPPCEANVKAGGIDENRQLWTPPLRPLQQRSKAAVGARQARNDLGNAYHRELV